MAEHRTLFWFRKGLRLHDNPTLIKALGPTTTTTAIGPAVQPDPSDGRGHQVALPCLLSGPLVHSLGACRDPTNAFPPRKPHRPGHPAPSALLAAGFILPNRDEPELTPQVVLQGNPKAEFARVFSEWGITRCRTSYAFAPLSFGPPDPITRTRRRCVWDEQ